VPTLVAGVAASLAAFLVEEALRPYLDVRIKALISLVVLLGIFYVTRRWLMRLRDG
jgi:hypothetical protein